MVLVFVGLALVLLAGPALAAGSTRTTYVAKTGTKQGVKRTPQVLSMTGRIYSADDITSNSVFVQVQMTNSPYKYLRGSQLTVWMASKTVYYVWSSNRNTRIRLYTLAGVEEYVKANLSYPVKISINAVKKDGRFEAKRVEVNKPRYQ